VGFKSQLCCVRWIISLCFIRSWRIKYLFGNKTHQKTIQGIEKRMRGRSGGGLLDLSTIYLQVKYQGKFPSGKQSLKP
jgi:hypothetical protein